MRKKKILWFGSVQFTDEKISTTGTWLYAMGEALTKNDELELYNVTYGDVSTITQRNYRNIKQWIVPYKYTVKYKKVSKDLRSFIEIINDEIKPDLIHVWGTEDGFGYSVIESDLKTPVLLEIQGLLFSIVKNYYGGLSFNDLINCIGLKEILRPRNHPYFIKKRFKKKGQQELLFIKRMDNISVQSDWVKSIINRVNPGCNLFNTGIMLRNEFYNSQIWNPPRNFETINIFTSCSGSIPYKGMSVLFDAIALLKNKYPNIRLNIGGNIQREKKYGLIRDGYTTWMLRRIIKLGIQDSINWLGKMTANEMITEMHKSNMVVIPSFVETYSLFLAESMMLGLPTIASFAGAMPQLAEDEKTALFFPIGDHWSCARQIERLIKDVDLAKKLSVEARRVAFQRNNKTKVIKTQLEIYDKIINN